MNKRRRYKAKARRAKRLAAQRRRDYLSQFKLSQDGGTLDLSVLSEILELGQLVTITGSGFWSDVEWE